MNVTSQRNSLGGTVEKGQTINKSIEINATLQDDHSKFKSSKKAYGIAEDFVTPEKRLAFTLTNTPN